MHLRAADSGKSVRLRVGTRLDVELEENPTTGFNWMVAQLPSLLEFEHSDYLPDAPQRCGSGGRKTYHFKVARSGSGSLRLEYRRPWEKDVGPSGVFEVSLESA